MYNQLKIKYMRVVDVMQKKVDFVTTDTNVTEVCRLIFGRGINGVPVCKNKKVVGFITERDILAKFYPSMQDYVEDPIHMGDFEGMESMVSEILDLKAEKIMSSNPTTVTPDTPVLKAQSLMFLRKVGRLPVVDEKDNIIGIISKGDIFRAVVGKRTPLEEEEEFYDWLAKHYDSIIDWKKRLFAELPGLATLLKKEKVETILDVASGTGEHAIALAKKGFQVFGVEASSFMHAISENKKNKLQDEYKKKIMFLTGSYQQLLEQLPQDMNAAIFMGNALPFVLYTDRKILEAVANILNKDKSVIFFQILNLEKVFKIRGGLRDFIITKPQDNETPQAILTFYHKNKDKTASINHAVFNLTESKCIFRGIRSTRLLYLEKQDIIERLKQVGFSDVTLYGSLFYEPLLKTSFKPLESDWLNVVAKRN